MLNYFFSLDAPQTMNHKMSISFFLVLVTLKEKLYLEFVFLIILFKIFLFVSELGFFSLSKKTLNKEKDRKWSISKKKYKFLKKPKH